MNTKELSLAVSLALSALLTAPAFASGRHLNLMFVERATTDTTNHDGKGDDNAGDMLAFQTMSSIKRIKSSSEPTRAIASAWCQERPTSASGGSPLLKARSWSKARSLIPQTRA